MSWVLLNLNEAAEMLEITPAEMRSLAVQGEIECIKRGESFMFSQDVLDLWAGQHIITGDSRKAASGKNRQQEYSSLTELCPPQCVAVALPGNSRASIIKSLVELAEQSGFLYDPEDFLNEITRREEAGSTNIGQGVAIPHTLVREDGFFSRTFIALAKLAKPVYFNAAPDGTPTEILILSCSQDSMEHLDILRRISEICRFTDFSKSLLEAETPEEMLEVLRSSEEEAARLSKRKHK